MRWRRRSAVVAAAVAEAYSGRTAPGRLGWVDSYLVQREREALFGQGAGSVVVDVGIGDAASTTLELAASLGAAGLGAPPLVVGLEADGARADRARRVAEAAAAAPAPADAIAPQAALDAARNAP